MARPRKFKISEVIEALQHGYTPAGAARVLGCHADTIRNYAKRSKLVENELNSKRNDLVDLAELGLRKALVNYESWAIGFTLKTLGKSRGYVERQEFTGADGGPIALDRSVGFDTDKL